MSDNILDTPEREKKNLRKSYYTIIEGLILVSNTLFMALGLIESLDFTTTQLKSGLLPFMSSLVIPVLIIGFGLSPILYIYNWRKASIEYKKNGRFKTLSRKLTNAMNFVHIIAGLFWTIVFTISFSFFIGVILGFSERTVAILSIGCLYTAIFAILGPLQYWYLRMITKIYKGH